MHTPRWISFLAVGLIAVALVFSGCGKKSSVVTLKLAHGLSVDHPVHKAMEFMAQKALEKSGGKLKIDIYPNEQLGNEKECLEKLQLGAIDMTKVSSSMLENFMDDYKVYALPYLFRDSEHKWKVLSGPVGKEILQSGESKGLKGLVYYDAGARSFYTKSKPILKPSDLKGLKIRTQQSPMAMEMIKALGGSATPISWGELYTALQSGVVDGAENNPPSLYTSNHYEVAKYYSLDEHTMVPDVVLINTKKWNSLPDTLKSVLQQVAEESVEYQKKLWKDYVQECMQIMESKGLKVYHPDKTPFKEMSRSLWDKYADTRIGELAKRIEEVQ